MRGKRSTVVLFVRGLPADVTSLELKSFIRTQLDARGFKTKTVFSRLVGDCNVLRITDRETGTVEFHGLIEIRPAELAIRAVEILNGTDFKGTPLTIRRYRQHTPLGQTQGQVSGTEISIEGKPRPHLQETPAKIELVEATSRRLHAFYSSIAVKRSNA